MVKLTDAERLEVLTARYELLLAMQKAKHSQLGALGMQLGKAKKLTSTRLGNLQHIAKTQYPALQNTPNTLSNIEAKRRVFRERKAAQAQRDNARRKQQKEATTDRND